MNDTIFALSSGAPPAAIAIIRISGPRAAVALQALAGPLPKLRRATFRSLRDPASQAELDRALVLWLPGPDNATGEDCAELHCHGGRAVVAAIRMALAGIGGLRQAEPGEFTRRAFANGRIDLAEAEGLADLLAAETELQRRAALAIAGGALSRVVERWREAVLALSATIEAVLDFSDEGEVGEAMPDGIVEGCVSLAKEIGAWLDRPRAEPLKEGFRVVLAGPPNAGKSTLFNALIDREAAITAPLPGTTRDVLSASVALDGIPFVFCDVAGLREAEGIDPVERIGIERARSAAEAADLVLWLGAEGEGPQGPGLIEIVSRIDSSDALQKSSGALRLSALTGEGVPELKKRLVEQAMRALPGPGEAALNRRQADRLSEAVAGLQAAAAERDDPILAAEHLRVVRVAFDRLVGRTGTEDMLDVVFGRFCIGK